MKRFTLLISASLVVGLLVVPAGASAAPRADGSNCSYTSDEAVSVPAGPAVVYAGGDGVSGAAAVSAGACLDLDGAVQGGGNQFDGGTAEAGAGIPSGGPGAYAVVDGDNDNLGPNPPENSSQGYIGVSTFETGVKDPSCNATDDGTMSNSGGCVTLRDQAGNEILSLPVPLLVCGNDSGKVWENSNRDGCKIP